MKINYFVLFERTLEMIKELHVQFRVTLFDNFNDISTFTTARYLM